jgi:hypothetical protein
MAPRDLVASDGSSADGVELSWSTAVAGDGFNIYRSSGAGAPALIGTSRSMRFRDTTAAPMTSYSYVVRAQAGPGESAPSNTDRGWRSVAAPASVSATDGTEREFVRVTWTPSSSPAVTGYRVLRRLPGGQLTQLDAVPASAVTINDKTIAPGVVGTYVVRCITVRGDSAEGTSDTGFRPTGGSTGGDGGGNGGGGDDGGAKGVPTDATPMKGASGGTEDRAGREGDTSRDHGTTGEGKGRPGDTPAGTDAADAAPEPGAPPCESTGSAPRTAPDCEELIALIRILPADCLADLERAMLMSGDTPAACRIAEGDVNLDGCVDDRDLAAFLVAWADRDLVRGDLNRDGAIDAVDFGLLTGGSRSSDG